MMNYGRYLKLQFLFFTLIFLVSIVSHATIVKTLAPKWQVHDPLSQKVIDHRDWQAFLNQHVKTNDEGINLIDYPHLSQQDHALLNRYINEMAHIPIHFYNRREQLAYWINLYNALTVQMVADYYPIASIQEINISPGMFSIGPWRAKVVMVNETRLSLDDIMNQIIRPIWNDPRVHYALNNASIGAANISKIAYQGGHLEEQLNTAAKEYINSLRALQVIDDKIVLSKIYKWYKDDFGETEEDVILHLLQFANSELQSKLQGVNKISSYMYNWHLNNARA